LVANEAGANQVLDALFSQGAHRITLTRLDCSENLVTLVRAAADAAGYEVLVRSTQKVPYVSISETTWEAYESGLPRKLRSELRRSRRRLDEEGRLTLEVFDGTEGLEVLLEEGFRIEGSGWKEAQGTSIYSSPAKHRFYSEAARWATGQGWLRLYFLRLDGRTLAFDYCFECNGILYGLTTGYDPAYAKFAPGKVLRYLLLVRAFSEGLTACDFGVFEAWKRRWTSAYQELRTLHAFAGEGWGQDSWYHQLYLATGEIAELIPPGVSFILVDEDSLHIDVGAGRRAIPFLERDGHYWGPPPDDEVAIRELERLRQSGAGFMIFGWPAFWWLEYYEGLHRYLRARYRCVFENERIVVFDLRQCETVAGGVDHRS
jgi:hypothetical protein